MRLVRLVRQAQSELGRRVDRRGEGAAAGATAEPSLDTQAPSARDIACANFPGELHRRAYRRTKPVPPKPSRLDPFAADVRVWLSLDPALTALAIHERLALRQGSLVSSRTVQRLVKRIRTEMLQHEIAAVSQRLHEAA